jgi:phosphoribosylformimino-5-aminoimidazole carboxamide ribonucleotide (ProFAR) isomerase
VPGCVARLYRAHVFEVIPAIDVRGGALVTLSSSGQRPVAAFGGDPVAAALAAVDAGARWVHLVDVDLAFDGEARNLGVLTEISSLAVSVQAAGGIRSDGEIEGALAAGAARVVLGSAALGDERIAAGLIAAGGGRLVVGIEEQGGRIRSRGRGPVDLPLMETLGWVVAAGASALVVTSVGRVGDRTGPDLDLIRRVVRAGRPVLAAGGISSLDDLRDLRAAGATGAIVGTAVLEGSIDLATAIRELSGGETTGV